MYIKQFLFLSICILNSHIVSSSYYCRDNQISPGNHFYHEWDRIYKPQLLQSVMTNPLSPCAQRTSQGLSNTNSFVYDGWRSLPENGGISGESALDNAMKSLWEDTLHKTNQNISGNLTLVSYTYLRIQYECRQQGISSQNLMDKWITEAYPTVTKTVVVPAPAPVQVAQSESQKYKIALEMLQKYPELRTLAAAMEKK